MFYFAFNFEAYCQSYSKLIQSRYNCDCSEKVNNLHLQIIMNMCNIISLE